MITSYDWITVAVFSSLVVLFLQRSDQPDAPQDALWQYLVAAAGCAVVNWAGNGGQQVAAIAALIGLIAFIGLILKPWPPGR